LSIAVGIAHCLRYLKRNNRQVLRSPCCNAVLCGTPCEGALRQHRAETETEKG
jgi:hypothetical protein